MQTGKFTIFDFDELQNNEKQEHYQKIIHWAIAERNKYSQNFLQYYVDRRANKMKSDLPISYYIQRANELISNKNRMDSYQTPSLNTVNEKLLFITNFVFPNSLDFTQKLQFYGIDLNSCLEFSEKMKYLYFYDQTKRSERFMFFITEYFESLDLIKSHYGTNHTSLIINKILEIAYLHPELLHSEKKKS